MLLAIASPEAHERGMLSSGEPEPLAARGPGRFCLQVCSLFYRAAFFHLSTPTFFFIAELHVASQGSELLYPGLQVTSDTSASSRLFCVHEVVPWLLSKLLKQNGYKRSTARTPTAFDSARTPSTPVRVALRESFRVCSGSFDAVVSCNQLPALSRHACTKQVRLL